MQREAQRRFRTEGGLPEKIASVALENGVVITKTKKASRPYKSGASFSAGLKTPAYQRQ
ncbi:MAG TPA: hypothetical protein VG347_04735 [Verrucomicrobiae bacterium]|nr:hypothetical protein [Verrucomicrobiae bacterium]